MPKEQKQNRREFFKRAGSLTARAGLAGALLAGFHSLRGGSEPLRAARGELGLLRPPGSQPEAEFLALCIRCTRCADACDTECIRFIGPQGGALQGTPYILPNEKACNMCLECGKSCPTAAIKPLERMEEIEMGLAVVDERICLPLAGRGVCGACHTVCPLRNDAITLDIRNAPTIHADHCTGCGLCEEICLVRNPEAIFVKTQRRADSLGTKERP